MSYLQTIIFGFLQGLTEFLPISSSGHLVLVPYFLRWSPPSASFIIILHFGTLIAAVIFFRKELAYIGNAFLKPNNEKHASSRKLLLLIIIATVPSALVGFLFEKQVKNLFSNPAATSLFLFLTAILLYSSNQVNKKYLRKNNTINNLEQIDYRQAITIGLAQMVSIAPGVSRSGTTISAGLFLGLDKEAATRFSFLISIPIILGANINEIIHYCRVTQTTKGAEPINLLILGFISAFISGYLAIKYFLKYLKKGDLKIFSLYCALIATVGLILSYFQLILF